MKIKIQKMDYEKVLALPKKPHQKPKKTNIFFRTLLKVVSTPDLIANKFTYTEKAWKSSAKTSPASFS